MSTVAGVTKGMTKTNSTTFQWCHVLFLKTFKSLLYTELISGNLHNIYIPSDSFVSHIQVVYTHQLDTSLGLYGFVYNTQQVMCVISE